MEADLARPFCRQRHYLLCSNFLAYWPPGFSYFCSYSTYLFSTNVWRAWGSLEDLNTRSVMRPRFLALNPCAIRKPKFLANVWHCRFWKCQESQVYINYTLLHIVTRGPFYVYFISVSNSSCLILNVFVLLYFVCYFICLYVIFCCSDLSFMGCVNNSFC